MGTGVEPCEAASQRLHLQLAILEEALVHCGDLQLTACRRLDRSSYIDDFVGVEVQADDGIVGFGLGRLLLDAEAVAIGVELSHAVALRVADPIAEHRRFVLLLCSANGFVEHGLETVAVEDVVA